MKEKYLYSNKLSKFYFTNMLLIFTGFKYALATSNPLSNEKCAKFYNTVKEFIYTMSKCYTFLLSKELIEIEIPICRIDLTL